MSRNTQKILNADSSGTTERTGYTFVSNVIQPLEVSGDVKAKDIYTMSENMYVIGAIRQLINLVVSGDISISVYDENDDIVEDVSRELNKMFSTPKCNLTDIARSSLFDNMMYGITVWNPVWNREGTPNLTCKEMVHLNPYSFAEYPQMANTQTCTYGRLLHGIYYDMRDNALHFVQRQNQNLVELNTSDLFIIKDSASQNPDGTSLVMSMCPIIKFLNYCWNAFGQQMFRTAAPIMFVRIANPQPAVDVNGEHIEGDVEYANRLLKSWGKDTGFNVRENMDVHIVDVKEGSLAKVAIQIATEAITNYVSPVGMLGKDGTLISGNSDASLRLVNNYIQGWAKLLTNTLRDLPNYYLKYNGYPKEWHAEIVIESVTIEDSAKKLSYAQLLSSTKSGSINEVRELLGLEGVSDEELVQMKSQWDILADTPAPTGLFGFSEHSTAPTEYSYRKQREIAHRTESDIDDSTDKLLRGALRIMRSAKQEENRNQI